MADLTLSTTTIYQSVSVKRSVSDVIPGLLVGDVTGESSMLYSSAHDRLAAAAGDDVDDDDDDDDDDMMVMTVVETSHDVETTPGLDARHVVVTTITQ